MMEARWKWKRQASPVAMTLNLSPVAMAFNLSHKISYLVLLYLNTRIKIQVYKDEMYVAEFSFRNK